MNLERDPVLNVYDAIQNGVTVNYADLAPWVLDGYTAFMAEMRRARRMEDAHAALEKQMGLTA